MWKLLRQAAPDFLLALGDSHPEVKMGNNKLKTRRFMSLSALKPDMGQWKSLSEAELLEAMEGLSSPAQQRIVQRLHTLSLRLPQARHSWRY